MYSVIRFTARDNKALLESVAAELNALEPGTAELQERRDHFACSLSMEADWDAHLANVSQFLARFRAAVDRAARAGVSMGIDVAVEPEDLEGRPLRSLGFGTAFLQELVALGIALEVSLYV